MDKPVDEVEWLPDSTDDPRPVRWQEVLALLLIASVADLAFFRGAGFAGYAAFLLATTTLLWWGAAARKPSPAWGAVLVLLVGVFARLVWCGGWGSATIGFLLLGSWAATISGRIPFVHAVIGFISESLISGTRALLMQVRSLGGLSRRLVYLGSFNWQAIVIPMIAVLGFSGLFLMANPDLIRLLDSRLSELLRILDEWLYQLSPSFWEILFVTTTAWVAAGWLRPRIKPDRLMSPSPPAENAAAAHPLYDAYRNTLVSLSLLFLGYLAFEFQTLWFRKLPIGFDYAGYAHQGAFWLTVALGLATCCLSAMFRGRLRVDPRLPNLQRWAAIWAVLNLVLAAAVYNRLWIYVRFNGLTRLRLVGFLGVTAVIVGFLLVLRKISRNHGFWWLLQRQLWTLAGAFYLFYIFPVDWGVTRYNAQRIRAGTLTPGILIGAQYNSDEALLQLVPLLDGPGPEVRDGIRAILYLRHRQIPRTSPEIWEWTGHQIATEKLRSLIEQRSQEVEFPDLERATQALRDFEKYAAQFPLEPIAPSEQRDDRRRRESR